MCSVMVLHYACQITRSTDSNKTALALSLLTPAPVCVQAAVTVARRVAQECECELGQEVGYAVRFEERASSSTKIKYLTGAFVGP